MAATSCHLPNIQGNIFGGFNKDFQDFIFLSFKDPAKGRQWIAEAGDDIQASSSEQVLRFNAQYKSLKARGLKPEHYIAASWVNLALSFKGMAALGMKAMELDKFPIAFRQGMAARSQTIGDTGASAPANWPAPFQSTKDVHAVLIVGADSDLLLKERIDGIVKSAAFIAGVQIISGTVHGRTRVDEPGHEHFGFKDGVSQPGIRGVTHRDDPIGNPNQGQPGQDLLWGGEFVLGYPTQIPKAKPDFDGPNPDPGPLSASGPAWTQDGSYLVFRRLQQDVPAFKKQVIDLAAANHLDPDEMGAKLVGRYKSGCPIETRKFAATPSPTAPPKDPGIKFPALADNDTLDNNFEFGDDEDGSICPLASHIRKAYPRDEQTLDKAIDSESDTQTHRLLRRGIPYGASIGQPVGGGANDPRGLVFVCYQKDIESQFEFVQTQWVNDPKFPTFPAGRPTPGEDPIITQTPQGAFQNGPNGAPLTVKHFVTTTGGEYFFAPSIATLADIGAGKLV